MMKITGYSLRVLKRLRNSGRNDIYILERAIRKEPGGFTPKLKTTSPEFIKLLKKYHDTPNDSGPSLPKRPVEEDCEEQLNEILTNPTPVEEPASQPASQPQTQTQTRATPLYDYDVPNVDMGSPITTAEQAEIRKEIAVAYLKELEIQQKRGDLVNFQKVNVVMSTLVTETKQRLMAIPDRVAKSVARMTDPAEVRQKLRAELIEAMEGLTNDIRSAL